MKRDRFASLVIVTKSTIFVVCNRAVASDVKPPSMFPLTRPSMKHFLSTSVSFQGFAPALPISIPRCRWLHPPIPALVLNAAAQDGTGLKFKFTEDEFGTYFGVNYVANFLKVLYFCQWSYNPPDICYAVL